MPKVSAIVSTYNSARFIRGCLDDLLNQTLALKGELEIVVVISGSPENEDEIVLGYQRRYPNIIAVRTQRETMYEAWNRGIKIASGTYVTNANTDDRHRADAFEVLSAALDKKTEIDVAYGDCYLSTIENESFEQNSKTRVYRYPAFFAPASVLHYQLSPQAMWRRSVHDSIGYFDGALKCVGDYDFNFRIALQKNALHVGGSPIGLYLEHPQALSFRDDRIKKENDALQAKYRTKEMIERLYARAGVTWQNTKERAQIHLDMGIRALEYYPPWFEGRTHCEPQFALECFERAISLEPDNVGAYNNIAITYALAGDLARANNILLQLSQQTTEPMIETNYRHLQELQRNPNHNADLTLTPSPLQLPNQKELYLPSSTSESFGTNDRNSWQETSATAR